MTPLYMELDRDLLVKVRRTVKAFGTTERHGPMSIDEAFKAGHLDSSSGTVTCRMEIAEGPYRGRDAILSGRRLFVSLPDMDDDGVRDAVARGAVFYLPTESSR